MRSTRRAPEEQSGRPSRMGPECVHVLQQNGPAGTETDIPMTSKSDRKRLPEYSCGNGVDIVQDKRIKRDKGRDPSGIEENRGYEEDLRGRNFGYCDSKNSRRSPSSWRFSDGPGVHPPVNPSFFILERPRNHL